MTPAATTEGSGDPRTARTRGKLREALLAACEEQPLDQVSVSDVVRRAGVGRATFYLHYDDLRALAVDACAEIVRQAVDALHAWDEVPPGPDAPPPSSSPCWRRYAPGPTSTGACCARAAAARSASCCTGSSGSAASANYAVAAPGAPRRT